MSLYAKRMRSRKGQNDCGSSFNDKFVRVSHVIEPLSPSGQRGLTGAGITLKLIRAVIWERCTGQPRYDDPCVLGNNG